MKQKWIGTGRLSARLNIETAYTPDRQGYQQSTITDY